MSTMYAEDNAYKQLKRAKNIFKEKFSRQEKIIKHTKHKDAKCRAQVSEIGINKNQPTGESHEEQSRHGYKICRNGGMSQSKSQDMPNLSINLLNPLAVAFSLCCRHN